MTKNPIKIVKTLESQITSFDLLSTKKGFAIGNQNGKIFCFDILKEGLSIDIDPTITLTEKSSIKILKSF